MDLFDEPPFQSARPAAAPVISVSELNRRVRAAMERGVALAWVAGEISNMRRYDSGHWYFTLKDADAQVDCVMFRHKAQGMDWAPADGMRVEVRGLPTVYEARGKYQLNVDAMRRAGQGALYEAFERLKAKLDAEGLFDAERKREIPAFPRAIGVVSSPQAAALRDVITTLRRRMPCIPLVIYPTPVQGEGAAVKIAQAIALASARAKADTDEIDVLIVCRGGGSIEDLWSFNEEIVARAIHACAVPVVSGVGHETDFTIADFVADMRAPTPTAAAELVSPERDQLREQVIDAQRALSRTTRRMLEDHMQKLDYLQRRLTHPGERIAEQTRQLKQLGGRFVAARARDTAMRVRDTREWARRLAAAAPDVAQLERDHQALRRRVHAGMRIMLEQKAAGLARVAAHVNALDPQRQLERGYSIAEKSDGAIVRDATVLAAGDALKVTFAKGAVMTKVE